MRDCYAAADVLAFPSETETQGLVLCEAMAAGLPFVAVESPGARSVVPDEADRYVIPNDAKVMAARILDLAENRDERQRLAVLGRAAAEQFTETAAAHHLRKIYCEAIGLREKVGALETA
jgi:glycosyltransferase involved in cell wall biosynthesis